MTESNNRVTLAVIQNELQHVRGDIASLRADIKTKLNDHEDRLRCVEKRNVWSDVIHGSAEFVALVLAAFGIRNP